MRNIVLGRQLFLPLGDNYCCRRIDSRFWLPEAMRLPHINCYPAAELRGGGGDGEAIEHGDTARAEKCDWRTVSSAHKTAGATADPVRIRTSDRVSSQTRAARAESSAGATKPAPTGATLR